MGAFLARYPVVQAVEKSLGARGVAARTPNRHWWSGREYQAIERILVKELGKSLPCLGIRETPGREEACPRSVGGWHRPGGSDCLPKTQVHAKAQAAVYALTPARCRKVKRIRQPFWVKR